MVAVGDRAGHFDIGRRPNGHLALGVGEHACIGAAMARTQMPVLLAELLEADLVVEPACLVTPLRSIVVNGPAHMPVRVVAQR